MSNTQKTMAITGITGHTGGYFLEELINNNYKGEIRCLVRGTKGVEKLKKSGLNIKIVSGDIEDDKVINKLLSGAEILVHIVNIKYSPRLVKLAKLNKVKRIILVHTTGIYSKHKKASEEYIKIEKKIEKYLNDKNLDITILQPTMIYGDLCDHNVSKFIKLVDKFPIIPEVNHGKALIQPVNARDLGKAYYLSSMTQNLPKSHYITSGRDAITMHDTMKIIAELLSKKRRFLSIPSFIAEGSARIIYFITFHKIDIVEKVQRLSENRNFPYDNAKKDFNYSPEKFTTGLKREVEQYNKAKNETR